MADVPSSAVNDLPAALASPQIVHRQMVREIEHPIAGALKILRNPIRFSETPIEDYSAPPSVGEQTDEILSGLGYGPDQLNDLRARKVI